MTGIDLDKRTVRSRIDIDDDADSGNIKVIFAETPYDILAAVELFGVRLYGFVAWLVWRTLYLMKLVGFGNKLRVVLDWTLDLVIERSISQIAVNRQDLRADAALSAEKVEAERPPSPEVSG